MDLKHRALLVAILIISLTQIIQGIPDIGARIAYIAVCLLFVLIPDGGK